MPKTPSQADPGAGELEAELAGIDVLEYPLHAKLPRAKALWQETWPKLGAVALGLLAWQAVVASGWKPDYLLPGPAATF